MKKTTFLAAGLMMSLLTACNLSNSQTTAATLTPVALVVTATPSNTPEGQTAEPLPPSATSAASETPTSTTTPTEAVTPTHTAQPTMTYTPSLTPQPTVGFRFDNWDRSELPAGLKGGAKKPMVIFTNSNDQDTITSLATAHPENKTLLVFAVDPDFPDPGNRITLLTLNAATGTRIYPSASGNALAYFRDGSMSPGLYILNMADGLSGRIAAINTLVQRGIYAPPQWSPDGEQLAVTLATPYDLDIFLYERDGSRRDPLAALNTGAYEFYPVWSPDGRFIAFVSDRATCPSWIPGDKDACDPLTTPPPVGGQVYVLELETGEVRQISDQYVTEPPTWVNNTLLAFAVGDGLDLLKPERQLWLANIPGKTARPVALSSDTGGLYLSDAWSPDGTKVLFQYVTPSETSLVLMNTDGTVIEQKKDDLIFPRYGLRASWSSQNERIALGGASGECPYGVRVIDLTFAFIARGNASPTMCTPTFSPNGRFIAFAGISSARDKANPDGRQDVYVSDYNGFGQRNLSADLRGTNTLIGWLGGK